MKWDLRVNVADALSLLIGACRVLVYFTIVAAAGDSAQLHTITKHTAP